MPDNLWNPAEAPAGDGLANLAYRSRLLGADRSVCNIFGGNTSTKATERDHRGRGVEVLWVKGSGSDLASIDEGGFAGLHMDDIAPLMAREAMSDEEMVAYLAHTLFALDRPRQSIETLLHGFTPAKHVDHTHPDAVISLACTPDGRQLCQQLWGDEMVWVDYIRPGFTLSKWIGEGIRANPRAGLVVMGKHGLVTWGEAGEESYRRTIEVIQQAEDFIAERRGGRTVFAGAEVPALPRTEREQLLGAVLPELRGALSAGRPAILALDDSPEVLAFVGSTGARELSQLGAACPDHLVHTKRQPLFLEWTPTAGVDALKEELATGVERFVEDYRAYFEANRGEGDELRDPTPRVILIPGVGMVTSGPDAKGAEVSRQLYHRAIEVIAGSEVLGGFVSLSPEEAYAIEYWPLELYKLLLKPPPREQAGRVAVVTGGASGIGRATALRLAEDHAQVAILDIDLEGAKQVAATIENGHGAGRALALRCDVTDEDAVGEAFARVVRGYGGVDVVVSNAGISVSAPIEATTLDDWQRMNAVMNTGYFLVSREAFRLWKRQGRGGTLIFVASKNSVYAGKNAAAYSAAKAAELHLARCLAEEGGAFGIRVNSVMPDAVLQGSGIWDQGWREQRARNYGIAPDELDEFYRQRTTLKVSVYPENIAEAISFLAGPRASRTTGGVLTVDGGVSGAYLR